MTPRKRRKSNEDDISEEERKSFTKKELGIRDTIPEEEGSFLDDGITISETDDYREVLFLRDASAERKEKHFLLWYHLNNDMYHQREKRIYVYKRGRRGELVLIGSAKPTETESRELNYRRAHMVKDLETIIERARNRRLLPTTEFQYIAHHIVRHPMRDSTHSESPYNTAYENEMPHRRRQSE